MEELLIPLAIFVFLAFPVWTLVLLHRILRRQDHQFSLLNVTVQARPTAKVYTFAARKGHRIATTCGS